VRKIFFVSVFLLIFFFLSSTNLLFAQEKTSNDYYQDLLKNFQIYQDNLSIFNVKKSRHLSLQTVDTGVELLDAVKNLILSEIKSMSSYTHFIRSYLAEATLILNYQENYLYVKLDDEIVFLRLAEERAKAISSLTEVNDFMQELALHYKTISSMGYQVKAIVDIWSVTKIFENLKVDTDKILNYINQTERSDQVVFAAKDKLAVLDRNIKSVDEQIKNIEKMQSKITSVNAKDTSENIKNIKIKILDEIGKVIDGYENIVLSLR